MTGPQPLKVATWPFALAPNRQTKRIVLIDGGQWIRRLLSMARRHVFSSGLSLRCPAQIPFMGPTKSRSTFERFFYARDLFMIGISVADPHATSSGISADRMQDVRQSCLMARNESGRGRPFEGSGQSAARRTCRCRTDPHRTVRRFAQFRGFADGWAEGGGLLVLICRASKQISATQSPK